MVLQFIIREKMIYEKMKKRFMANQNMYYHNVGINNKNVPFVIK